MLVRPFGARELRALEEDQASALDLAIKGALRRTQQQAAARHRNCPR